MLFETFLSKLKVKVALEGQLIKLSEIELFRAIISTFTHVFQNNLAQLFYLKGRNAI